LENKKSQHQLEAEIDNFKNLIESQLKKIEEMNQKDSSSQREISRLKGAL
jgi:hypothetical protein